MSSQAVVSAANQEVSSNKVSNNCQSPSFKVTDLDDSSLQKNSAEQSFNNSANNSSGLGDSISMPCLLNDCSSSSSSIYDGSNTVNNVIYSSSGSLPGTPTSSNTSGKDFSRISSDTSNFTNLESSNQKDFSKSDASDQKSEYSSLRSSQFGNSLGQQLNSLNLNEVDYSPFNDYMGIDKMILQMAVADGQKSKGNFNLDPMQQQQIIAQALAAVASGNHEVSSKPQSRSITENIELLNSKLLSHKSQNNSSDKYSDNQNNINGLQSNQNNIQNNSDLYLGYNSSNLPTNIKRQSYPQANQSSNSHMFASTTSNNIHSLLNSGSSSVQSSLNNRVSSVANDNQTSNKYLQSHDKHVSGSLSASNSSFNFNVNGSNDTELSSRNNLNQCSFTGNNSNCYDDDDVFSSNNSFNSSLNQSNRSENNNQSNNSNLDTIALAQLYRNFLTNGVNNNNNNTGNRNDNMSELLSNYNSNLTALSLNPDLINSNSFLNSTNSIANQLKSMNNNSSNSTNNNFSNKNANVDQIAAALLKQRQNLMNTNRPNSSSINNTSTNNPSSNIAALTSATSNIASLLNLNNNGSQQNSQHFQQVFGDQKRRMNSNTNATGNGSNNLGSMYSNNSLFNTSVGPNASHLLQNSSLASSARLNSATSSSAAASVLGNNSTLHALSSLQHQSNSGNLNNSQNNHQSIFNSSSNNNGNNNGNNMHHQSNLLNFNMSPSSASNHGILSALSLSSTTGNSLQNQLLSASGKPLRSERLPSHYVEEIVKQAKIRRRNGGKKEVCVFCRNNGEKEQIYTSHTLKDASNHVACPILRQYQCPICRASGDLAHTIKYCPYAEKDSNCIKLFKENGRMSAAAALLMNSLAGGNASPHSLSPPSTPPPSHSSHSLMHQNLGSLDIQSPSHHNSLNAYLNSSLNFDMSSSNNCKNNESVSSLNKSFSSNCSSMMNSTQNSAYAKPTTNSLLTSRESNSSLLSSNFSNNLNK